MTRLTKDRVRRVVEAIIEDIPHVDYAGMIQKKVDGWSIETLPDALKRALQVDPTLKDYLAREYVPECRVYTSNVNWKPSQEQLLEVGELGDKSRQQREQINKMRGDLYGMFASVTTVAKAIKTYPEFEKYLKAVDIGDHGATSGVPATLVLTELARLGWPK